MNALFNISRDKITSITFTNDDNIPYSKTYIFTPVRSPHSCIWSPHKEPTQMLSPIEVAYNVAKSSIECLQKAGTISEDCVNVALKAIRSCSTMESVYAILNSLAMNITRL